MSSPVLQHYVPSFYLKRFTVTGRDNGPLYVFEKQTGTWLPDPSTPKAEAKEPHLNTLEIAGVKQHYVEKFLDVIESEASDVRGHVNKCVNKLRRRLALPAALASFARR
jgi:hypothetical protein